MHGLSLVSLFILLAVSLSGMEPKAGALLLKDDFERKEMGKQWRLRIGSFVIQDGVLVGTQKPEDGHGAVVQAPVAFQDAIIEFSFRIVDGRSFNFVVNDKTCKTVHAGHICRVAVSMKGFRLGDDKEGVMRNDIFAMRRDPKRKKEANALLVGRSRTIPFKLKANQWYRLRVTMIGEEMRLTVDGKELGLLRSPGIAHPTKSDFGFTVKGKQVEFDEVRVWKTTVN
ncbi:MAG: hypothetical protein CMI30_06820 [Opitutae bacterium]|nr:hypothetical protein [Opitutae bacterium]|tara:strand:- start:1766 stop:2446 length:681 start_codon:yes stop_codon:yes gene_type:complete